MKDTLNLKVTDNLSVAVIQHPDYEFLMSTKQVSLGYGVANGTIRSQKRHYQEDLKEGKHYVKGVQILHALHERGTTDSNTLSGVQPYGVYWTKAGVIRLGFYIKSKRAKLFRDWAESVILEVLAPQKSELPPVKKGKHNRLTPERTIDLMAAIAEVENKELRMRMIHLLLPEHSKKD